MIEAWWIVPLLFGVNFCLWGTVGIVRFVDGQFDRFRATVRNAGSAEHLKRRHLVLSRHNGDIGANLVTEAGAQGRHRRRGGGRHARLPTSGGSPFPFGQTVELGEVAVLMAAHNEAVVIEDSLSALTALVDPGNVYVVSDCSTDRTVELAQRMGVNVTETPVNVGKAGAIEEGIRTFRLLERYEVVMLLDADTRLDPKYFTEALPLFDDPNVVGVAGCAHSHWRGATSWLGRAITAHRSRVYALTQRLIKYGQTWRLTNATHVVPGFASMYRTRALQHITINPPGLVIEDFNMTFEVYRKRLGRVAFNPRAIAVTQDPDNFHDYVRQMKRWALGLWQTVRRHRLRPDLLSVSLTLLLGELMTASIALVLLPLVLLLVLPLAVPALGSLPGLGDLSMMIADNVSLQSILFGVLVADVILTCLVASVERRPQYLLYAPLFIAFRVVDAGIALFALPRAWLEKSNGRWVSPTRRDPNTDASSSAPAPNLPAPARAIAPVPSSVPTHALATDLQDG